MSLEKLSAEPWSTRAETLKRQETLLAEMPEKQILSEPVNTPYRIPPRQKSSKPLLFAFVAVIAGLGLWSMNMMAKVAPLAAENSKLSAELKTLRAEVANYENEAKDLRDRTEKAEKERKNLKDALDNYKRENESAVFQLKKAESRATTAEDEKTYLEEMLIRKTKAIESLKSSASAAPAPVPQTAPVGQELEARLAAKDEEIRRLSEENRTLNAKIDKLYRLTNEKMAEINVAKITLEETIASARKKIEQDFAAVDLGAITVDPKNPAKAATPTAARSEGRILAINDEHRFVVIDLGKADNIQSDMLFAVRRNGEKIATLSVLEVRDVMSACNIKDIAEGKKLAVNDAIGVES